MTSAVSDAYYDKSIGRLCSGRISVPESSLNGTTSGDTVVYRTMAQRSSNRWRCARSRRGSGITSFFAWRRKFDGSKLPADNVDLVRVRDVVNAEGLDKVFTVLRQPYTEEPTNWSRRYKTNLEKVASGDVIKVAESGQDLFRREQERACRRERKLTCSPRRARS